MWRKTHLWAGLLMSILILVVSLTGTVLATKPMYKAYNASSSLSNMSVATAIENIAKKNKRITPQKLTIYPSGDVKLNYTIRNQLKKRYVSLTTGKFLRKQEEPKIYAFVANLHRSFLLGDKGRIFPAISAISMFILSISGIILLIRRLGGIRYIIASMSWKGLTNQHSALGRLAIIPLLIMVITALWLSAVTFKLVSGGEDKPPQYPESLQELDYIEPWKLKGLQNIPMTDVVEIVYPIPSDWFDVWTVKTNSEYIFVDQFTGELLSKQSLSGLAKIMHWVVILHTGQGSVWWSLILLLSSLSIPFFAVSGVIMWFKNRKLKGGKIYNQATKNQANILILVGSENGSTWGFAKALHKGLVQTLSVQASTDGDIKGTKNCKVRTIDMNAVAGNYPAVHTVLILTATYGDGDAPQSAKQFLQKLDKFNAINKSNNKSENTNINYAVLAFGDRAFPKFCAFAHLVANAMQAKFGQALLPLTEVDKQSSQTFSTWTRELGEQLHIDLAVDYEVARPKTKSIKLFAKQDFAKDIAPMSILRFNSVNGKKLPKHKSGDWLVVYPPQCSVPRLYSLGSDSRYDKFIEICVRLQEGGLCSTLLCNLSLDDEIDVAIIENPRFHVPAKGSVIMIGAGTGIAPFIGMIKHNYAKRHITLFWGGRAPHIDGIYQDEIKDWLEKKHLTHFYPAWSRDFDKTYVQQQVAKHHGYIIEQLQQGATIMICGGRKMEQAVYKEIDICAKTIGLTVEELKKNNRYLEDVY